MHPAVRVQLRAALGTSLTKSGHSSRAIRLATTKVHRTLPFEGRRCFASVDNTISPSPQKGGSSISQRLPDPDEVEAPHRFREFELDGRVYIVTGGARGLGLTVAEALVEAGSQVYCLDRAEKPEAHFFDTQKRLAHHYGGSLHYRQVDVQDPRRLEEVVGAIADEHSRMDGLVAAAGVQHVKPALHYEPEKVAEMMGINFGGVFLSAVECARQMVKYKTPGSIVLVGSMSGLNANRGLTSSVYNSSKAAVIQLGRSLAMEASQFHPRGSVKIDMLTTNQWGNVIDGKAIRVNVLSPGNIMTSMVEKNFADDPTLREKWETANMLSRISDPKEYRGATLFLLSDASSFMTASNLVVDGGQ